MKYCILFLSFILSFNPVKADISDFKFHGFSKDGSVFAYSQSGVSDGSGFPYSEVHYIKISDGYHLDKSPIIRVFKYGSDEHKKTSLRSEKIFSSYPEVSTKYSKILVSRLITEAPTEPYKLSFYTSKNEILRGESPFSLELIEAKLPKTVDCSHFGNTDSGFKLILKGHVKYESEAIQKIHKPPENSGCVISYHLSDIYMYESGSEQNALAIIIKVKTHGFEGPNIRWMGVAIKIAKK